MTWRRILFAVDSRFAVGPCALSKIAQLAGALEAEVELFQCVSDSQTVQAARTGAARSEAEISEMVGERRQPLEAVAGRLRNAGIRTQVAVRWDYPCHEGIIRQALRRKPDLVVAQSTRHARLARLMLTHTDYRLIEACPFPLLLMKTGRPYAKACGVVAAVDPMHAHAKPAALDQEIVDNAGIVAAVLGGKLHVYHACVPWTNAIEELPARWQFPEAVYAEVCAAYKVDAEARVKELARRQNVPDDRVHVEWGDPAEQLPKFVSRVRAGIVVMGAVSRTGIPRVFIGHTAERVLDALDCDVLVIKPRGFRSSVSRRSVISSRASRSGCELRAVDRPNAPVVLPEPA